MSALALVDIQGPIATLTLNRPEVRNPTSIAMLDAMDDALDEIESISGAEARVIILTGAGPAFCSGLDLEEVRSDERTIHTLLRRLSEVMRRIRRTRLPVIARVQGAAIGGGFGFVAAADFAITHPEAKLGYPPVELGLSGALMAPWLIRRIGPTRARGMLLAGGTITGEEAHRIGLVNQLVPKEQIESAAHGLAEQLAKAGVGAMTRMKHFLNELDTSNEDNWLDRAATESAQVIVSRETQDRLRTPRDR